MNYKKLKGNISISMFDRKIKNSPFFIIERKKNLSINDNVFQTQVLTKVICKNTDFSNHFDINSLKYPLISVFFPDRSSLLAYLSGKKNKSNKDIVFINAGPLCAKEYSDAFLSALSSSSLFSRFNLVLSSHVRLLRLLKIVSTSSKSSSSNG